MTNDPFHEFLEHLQSFRNESALLNRKIQQVQQYINSDYFIPDALVADLMEDVHLYSEIKSEIKRVADQYAVQLDQSITDVESELLHVLEYNDLRQIVTNYLRLTSENPEVQALLTASKEELCRKCASYTDGGTRFLTPYRLIVERVLQTESEITEEEFQTMADTIGLRLTRWIDKGKAYWDANANLSEWLDSSCELLIQPEKPEPSADSIASPEPNPMGQKETDTPEEASPDFGSEADQENQAEQAELTEQAVQVDQAVLTEQEEQTEQAVQADPAVLTEQTELVDQQPQPKQVEETSPASGPVPEQADQAVQTIQENQAVQAVQAKVEIEKEWKESPREEDFTVPSDVPGEPHALWDHFTGYAEHYRIEKTDPPSATFKISDLTRLAKKNPQALITLRNLFQKRVFPADAPKAWYQRCGLYNSDMLLKLKQLGLVTTFSITDPSGGVKEYFAPAEKAYGLLQNNVALSKVYTREPFAGRQLLKKLNRAPDSFTDLYYLRCASLVSWILMQPEDTSLHPDTYLSLADQDSNHVYVHIWNGEKDTFLCSGIFQKGQEQTSFDIIQTALQNTQNDCIILAVDPDDIPVIAGYIAETSPEIANRLVYALPDDDRPRDGQGQVLGIADATPAPDAAPDTATAPDAAPDATPAPGAAPDTAPATFTTAPTPETAETAEIPTTQPPSPTPRPQSEEPPKNLPGQADSPRESEPISLPPVPAAPSRKETSPVPSGPVKQRIDLQQIQEQLDHYLALIPRAVCQGQPEVAGVLYQALLAEARDIDELREKYNEILKAGRRFSYATNDPILTEDYRLANLKYAFDRPFGEDEAMDTMAIAAYLRMYFSQDVNYDSYEAAHITFSDAAIVRQVPSLHEALYLIRAYLGQNHKGINSQVLALAFQGNTLSEKLAELRKAAGGWIADNRLLSSSHKYRRIIDNRKRLFGKGTIIQTALEAIAQGDTRQLEAVNRALGLVNNHYTPKNVEDLMDSVWDQSASGRDKDPLVGVERATLTNQLNAIFRLFDEWKRLLEANLSAQRNGKTAVQDELHELREKLTEAVKHIDQLLTEEKSARLTKPAEPEKHADHPRPEENAARLRASLLILRDTLKELLVRYEKPASEGSANACFYINLLRLPCVSLDEGFLPYIEGPEVETSPFEFCNRVARYLDTPLPAWPDVIARIFQRGTSRIGGDFGCALVLREYLETFEPDIKWPEEYDRIDDFARDAANIRNRSVDALQVWQQDFQGRLDLADSDEWFRSPGERKRLQAIANQQYQVYALRRDYGFYGRALLRILNNLRQTADQSRAVYEKQLEDVRKNGTIPENAAIYGVAEKMIQRHRFGAFRSYLQMAERGETEVSESRLSDPHSYFVEFCRQCPDLCDKARLKRDQRKLASIYRSYGFYMENAIGRSAAGLINGWVESPDSAQPDNIQRILVSLGLDVESVSRQSDSFRVTLKDPGRVLNHPHPFADFGSRMYEKGLQVHCLFGNLTSDVLESKIRAVLQNNEAPSFLFLVNCALTLGERRKFAQKIASGMTQSSFLILDRSLALFLSRIPQAERWKALLQCSLPFHLINPYSLNTTSEIPPDIFIGRTRELDSILKPDGANLIFGGRQLGKTALLKRARVLAHRPADHHWAIYEDIKSMGSAEASGRIAKTLYQERFFPEITTVTCWRELMSRIEDRLIDTEDRLILFLDEADIFLVRASQVNYAEIDELKRLQDRTGGRFKCVMAGLHNVLRLNNRVALQDNSTLAHLLGLNVKPLDFNDARALLEIPLSYLGFTIPEENEDIITQILYNTNYFPGLIHFYASRLVDYMKTHAQPLREPPYELKTDTLLSLLAEQDFRNLRNDRIRMTLYLDSREHSYYDILATVLCYGYNINENYRLHGMSAGEIRAECESLNKKCSIARLSDNELKALLDELKELNILRIDGDRYQFSRQSFTEIFDSPGEVEEHLLEVLEKEGGII